MAAREFSANAYAVGLNVPPALLYSFATPPGMTLNTRALVLIVMTGFLMYELIFRSSAVAQKLPVISVIFGSIMFWAVVLMIYGHVDEANNTLYNIADVVLYSGIILIIGGILGNYIAINQSRF